MDFLQSEIWRHFQEAAGRRTFHFERGDFWANAMEHELPVVGKYWYIPKLHNSKFKSNLSEVVNLAKENGAGWIRLDIDTEGTLELLKKNTSAKFVKAPHDMQPREIFVIDIAKSEEELLAEMKPKTRYNIRLAEKKGVVVKCHPREDGDPEIKDATLDSRLRGNDNGEYLDEFLKLTKVMAKRQGITPHPDEYYRKMIETIPAENLRLYVAEYENRIIAANLMVFFEKTCIYLHGASDDSYRNVMAPYLLQWKQIQDARAAGCEKYDFGGVKTKGDGWEGITKFKLAFSLKTEPTIFLGSYDIILSGSKYWLYRTLQKLRSIV